MNCVTGVCSREMIYMFLVGQVSGLIQNFNWRIFSDSRNVINVKFCQMVLHIEVYLFIDFSMTLSLFQGHSNVKYFLLKFWCCYPIMLKLCWIVEYIKQVINIPAFFLLLHIFQGDNLCVSWFDKNFIVGFFTDTIQDFFFKLYIIIILLGIHQFMPGLMTLILFQGHRCFRIINCKLFVLYSCPP